jgi:hypothetical protein
VGPGALALLGLPVVVLLAVMLVRRARQELERGNATWRAFAEQRGLRWLPEDGPWYRRQPARIKGRVDDVDLVLDTYTESSTDANGNSTSTTYTRVVARAADPRRLDARVYRTHALSGLGKLLGFQDVDVGDPEFDVKANDADAVREWLGEDLRRALLGFSAKPSLRHHDGEVTLTWLGWERRPVVLDEALAIVRAACRREPSAYR